MNATVDRTSDKPEDSGNLMRTMSVFGVVGLGVGAMIGAGVFVLTGMAAGEAGPALLLAFVLNGCIALIVGSNYAELATMIPRAGGAYVWAKSGLGSFFGFYAGWMSMFAQVVACALYATAFGTFSRRLLGSDLPAEWSTVFTIAILILLLFINYRGAGKTGRMGLLITGVQTAILLLMVGFGLHVLFGRTQSLAPFDPFWSQGVGGLLSAMGITFIAFEGYEIIVQSSEELKNPDRNLPRAIFISILTVVAIYLLVAFVLLGAVNPPEGTTVHAFLGDLSELGLIRAAGQFMPGEEVLLLIAGLASTASALNATIYGSSRIAFAMGRDGDLPELFSRIHPKRNTPYISLAVLGLIMLTMSVTLPIRDIAASTNIMFLLVFIMVCVTVIRLRKSRPERKRPFRAPLVPWLPGLAILAGLLLSVWLLQISVIAWIVSLSWLTAGSGIYWLKRRPQKT